MLLSPLDRSPKSRSRLGSWPADSVRAFTMADEEDGSTSPTQQDEQQKQQQLQQEEELAPSAANLQFTKYEQRLKRRQAPHHSKTEPAAPRHGQQKGLRQRRRRDDYAPTCSSCGRSCSSLQLAFNYVKAGTRRDPRGLCVGIITVALVVGFSALLQSTIQRAPVIFMKLAEDQTGEADLLLLPSSAPVVLRGRNQQQLSAESGLGIPLLNATEIELRTQDNDLVAGAAPRWLSLAKIENRDNPLRNASCVLLVIDSEREEQMGLGREWGLRKLGEQEVYVVR